MKYNYIKADVLRDNRIRYEALGRFIKNHSSTLSKEVLNELRKIHSERKLYIDPALKQGPLKVPKHVADSCYMFCSILKKFEDKREALEYVTYKTVAEVCRKVIKFKGGDGMNYSVILKKYISDGDYEGFFEALSKVTCDASCYNDCESCELFKLSRKHTKENCEQALDLITKSKKTKEVIFDEELNPNIHKAEAMEIAGDMYEDIDLELEEN
jgi:hypothetical protein